MEPGEVADVDGIFAFGELTPDEISLLRKSTRYITFINGGMRNEDSDCIQVNLDLAWERALPYIAGADSVGIGLALSKEIIVRHGGYISVESEEGKGTTFFVKFIKCH